VSVSDFIAGGSLLIAGWAAWGTHEARAWQRRRDEERLATRVRVEVAHVVEPVPIQFGQEPEYEGFEVGVPPQTRDVVRVDAINNGEATEYVSAAFVVPPRIGTAKAGSSPLVRRLSTDRGRIA
jgi:hypothetical protein